MAKVYNKWQFTDEKGRFVPHDYQGAVYRKIDGKRQLVSVAGIPKRAARQYAENQKPEKERKPVRKSEAKFRPSPDGNKETATDGEFSQHGFNTFSATEPSDISQPAPHTYIAGDDSDDGLSLDEFMKKERRAIELKQGKAYKAEFKVNTKLLLYNSKLFSEKNQKDYYDILKSANEKGEEIGMLTAGLVEPVFSLKIPASPDAFSARLDAALEVLNSDPLEYVNNLAEQYYNDFKDNFKDILKPEDYKKFSKILSQLNSQELFKLLKKYSFTDLAYRLGSDISDFGYETVIADVKALNTEMKSFINRRRAKEKKIKKVKDKKV